MKTFLTNGVVALLLAAGALFLASPTRAQTLICWEICYPVWHEVCVVTPTGSECEGHWDEECYLECMFIP